MTAASIKLLDLAPMVLILLMSLHSHRYSSMSARSKIEKQKPQRSMDEGVSNFSLRWRTSMGAEQLKSLGLHIDLLPAGLNINRSIRLDRSSLIDRLWRPAACRSPHRPAASRVALCVKMEARSDAINICEKSIDQIDQSVEAGNKQIAVEKGRRKLENLPLPLIHHIMDSLSPKDSTKFSILSKTLNSSWLTYPVLHFDNTLFHIHNPHAFNAFVHRIFQLRAPHILGCLRTLRFCYKVNRPSIFVDFQPLLNQLLNFASLNNCKVLDFKVELMAGLLSLTDNALHPILSSEFLTTLKLFGFKLLVPDPIITLTCPALKLLSISFCTGFQTLHVVSPSVVEVEIIRCRELKNVIVDSHEIEYFRFAGVRRSRMNAIRPCDISIILAVNQCLKSMYLENKIVSEALMGVATKIMHLFCCNLPKNTKIYNPNVEILHLENCGVVENVVVCAPNVEFFEYSRGLWGQNCAIDISACVCLTSLALEGATIRDGWVKSVVSALTCLEELKLIKCDMLEKIEFKNARLETLVVECCLELKEAMVDAPNLLHFSYIGRVDVFPLLILSAKCNANITLRYGPYVVPNDWFPHLSQFLSCFDHFNVITISCVSASALIFPREFMLINMMSPLHDVKHVIVKVEEIVKGGVVPLLVDSLLWIAPKPDILTLESSLQYRWNARKMDEEEDNCCVGLPIKCWRHYDLNVEYEGFDDNDGGHQLQDFFASYT
ncbi:F-box domain, cyclin-like protein [Senna tora]|uniref:F-box domain, cyclin-like protein n=1 Tax=Senna tora TaxID=362788 RepID=A0A834X275_9FABA|nr:F-box domain, cyclin-like protein [Senna tora]